ncbi:MAG: hypothetical protein ACXU86_11375, partial [Archangium sp.]
SGICLGLLLLLQVGCATGTPLGGGMLGGYAYRPAPPGFQAAAPPREAHPASASGGGVGARPVLAEAAVSALARGPDGGARQEEVRERERRVEQSRAAALVLAAQREGRDAEAARESEADRALARVVGLCGGVQEVGATLSFAFWVQEGALTLVGYQEERGGGPVGRPVEAEGLARVLRHVFTEYMGRRTGEVVLKLRREQARWAADYDATHPSARPPEARTLPVRAQGTPADTFLAFQEAASKCVRAVQVPAGGAARVELAVRLEDGRLAGWELREVQRTREGPGGSPRPLSPEVAGHHVSVLLPFTEGLGARTVHVVLRAEHRLGEAEARGRVESARVERPVQPPGPSWYLSMHEATLLRWREGMLEGSAWLSQRGVEELALWVAGGIAARGLGFFATEGLEWVTRALGREPEVAAGWLRTALRHLSTEDRAAFQQLWRKVELEGEQALSRGERQALRGLFVRLEQAIQQPLDNNLRKTLRKEAREYYSELYPQFAESLDELQEKLPIHHRCPLDYAHLFPDEDINAGENLAMLQDYVHKRINALWGRFRRARPNPTADGRIARVAEPIPWPRIDEEERWSPWRCPVWND